MKLLLPLFVVFLAIATAFALWWGWSAYQEIFGAEYSRFEAIQRGMTEAEVLDTLGPPTLTHHRETAPQDYFVSGYSHPDRRIGHKVLIYVGREPIAYVFIDASGHVEDVYVGGS